MRSLSTPIGLTLILIVVTVQCFGSTRKPPASDSVDLRPAAAAPCPDGSSYRDDDRAGFAFARLLVRGQSYNYPGKVFDTRVDQYIHVNGDTNQKIWFHVAAQDPKAIL